MSEDSMTEDSPTQVMTQVLASRTHSANKDTTDILTQTFYHQKFITNTSVEYTSLVHLILFVSQGVYSRFQY